MQDEVGRRPDGGGQSISVASVVVGLLVAALTLAVGAAAVLERPTRWTAHTTLLVSPSASNDSASSASLYELLTQGSVAATYAALLRNGAFADSVIGRADVQRPDSVSLTAEVLPHTFLIRVTTVAPNSREAKRLARAAAKDAPTFADSLTRPFVLQAVDAKAIRTTRTSNVTPTVLGLIVAIALCLSVLAQQLAFQLFRLRRRRRARGSRAEPVVEPVVEPAAAAKSPGRKGSPPAATGAKQPRVRARRPTKAAPVSDDAADPVPAERS